MRPSLRVSAGAYPVHRWLVPLVGRAADQHLPEVNLVSPRAVSLGRAVVEGELDLAIMAGAARERGTNAFPLFSDELVAVLPPGHVLAQNSHLDAVALSEQVYVSYSRRIEDGLEDDQLFKPARKAPARFIEAHSVEAILEWVQAGAGFSILSRWAVAPAIADGRVASVRLTAEGLRIQWWAVVRSADTPNGLPAAFARYLASELGSRALCVHSHS